MERDQPNNLLDREERIVAEILSHFRNLVFHATDTVDSTASTGQAAYNSFAMDLMAKSLIRSIEDLLQLTRQLRELWVVGPLRNPGDGESEAEQNISKEVARVAALMNQLREQSRRKLVEGGSGNGTYVPAPASEPQAEGNAS